MHRGIESGFTLIEVLVVIAILGVVAAIVVLNISGLAGTGTVNAANTEAHQVQTAVIAYMEQHGLSAGSWTVGDGSEQSAAIERYLLNPGQLQARYSISDGRIADAFAFPDGRWAECSWDPEKGGWRRDD